MGRIRRANIAFRRDVPTHHRDLWRVQGRNVSDQGHQDSSRRCDSQQDRRPTNLRGLRMSEVSEVLKVMSEARHEWQRRLIRDNDKVAEHNRRIAAT